MSNFTGWDDLTRWANKVKGSEKIGVGIRPYGLHAGNMASLVAYPYLICEQFRKLKSTEPRFTYQVWLNDLEPVSYVGADGTKESADAANMYPEGTTFQFAPAPFNYPGSLVDYWQPVIEGVVCGVIGKEFPEVKLEFRRTSELCAQAKFRDALLHAVRKFEDVRECIDNNLRRVSVKVKGEQGFVWPLCPKCHAPVTDKKVRLGFLGMGEELVSEPKSSLARRLWKALIDRGRDADFLNKRSWLQQLWSKPEKFDWAMQFRILHAARLAIEPPDLWIIGLDHIQTNRSMMMSHLADSMNVRRYRNDFLHVPLVFADDSKKLSKSSGNAVFMSVHELINALRGNTNPGLDVENAFTSQDILAIGHSLLPQHVKHGEKQRQEALKNERQAYDKSSKKMKFDVENVSGTIGQRTVARMLGVPHL